MTPLPFPDSVAIPDYHRTTLIIDYLIALKKPQRAKSLSLPSDLSDVILVAISSPLYKHYSRFEVSHVSPEEADLPDTIIEENRDELYKNRSSRKTDSQ